MEFTDAKDRLLISDDGFRPTYELYVGVHFRMLDPKTSERLPCLAGIAALHDRARARGMKEADIMATFHAFRSEIEGIALDKFANGNNAPIVTTKDLH